MIKTLPTEILGHEIALFHTILPEITMKTIEARALKVVLEHPRANLGGIDAVNQTVEQINKLIIFQARAIIQN